MKMFRLVPEKWNELPTDILEGIYKAFMDWYILHEEDMSPSQAARQQKKANELLDYIDKRRSSKKINK